MINWFNMPSEGLSNGGQFEIKELSVTKNGEYEKDGEVYSKVTVNVSGGGGSSDFSTAEVTITANAGEGGVGLISTLTYGDPGYIFIDTHEDYSGKIGFPVKGVDAGSSTSATALLIDGEASFVVNSGGNVVVTGNAEYIADAQWLIIHGNCSITADPLTV